MHIVVPLLSSLISFVFALTVFDQFLTRRKPYQLVWTIGLLIYFVSTGCEFLIGAFGLNSAAYRTWYLGGAIFAAAYLGMGTIYLLFPRRAGHMVMALLLFASIYAIFKVFSAEVELELLSPLPATLTGKAMPRDVRLLTPFFNTFGSVALIGGALYSAWVFWRRRILPHRVVSNILIAVGAFFPLLAGTLSRLGVPEFLYIGELLGVTIIFLGFLRSQEVFAFYCFPLVHRWRRAA